MKKKNYPVGAMLLLCLLASATSYAQHTGSYDTTITFGGSPRAVSLYVPTTYNAANKYRLMVCLHGLGDTCNNYRNALAGPLNWPTNMPNTIFVCPEAAYRNGDYYYPTGGEAIIQSSIDFAMANYHIDTANVVLQGFSLGGEAALHYGLDNYAKFKGLLLNTPAIQGVKAAINATATHYTYTNASHIPIYITHGVDDIIYEPPIDTTYQLLIQNDGIVRYYDIPHMAHTIPPYDSMANFLHFLDTPTVAGTDLDVVSVNIPQRSCTTSVPATCLLRNTGDSTIHSLTLTYTVAGAPLTYSWTGTMAPFQHAMVSLPTITSPTGNQTLTVAGTSVNGGAADAYTYNNTQSVPFQVVTSGVPLPVFEGFEGVFPPVNWVQYLAGDAYSPWYADSTNKKTGIASMGAFNTILIFDNSGRREEMASPVMNFTTGAHAKLTFDVAYNYHHYTPPYLLIDTVFADTLQILVSADGGNTYSSVYKKGGSQLATFPSPILNPLSINADFITTTSSSWRTDTVDLSAFDTASKAIVKFSYISALGGSINIDNVNFTNIPLGIHDPGIADLQVYPNPATDKINIRSGNDELTSVTLSDLIGRTVYTAPTAHINTMTIETTQLPDGVYILQMTTTTGSTATRKITISK